MIDNFRQIGGFELSIGCTNGWSGMSFGKLEQVWSQYKLYCAVVVYVKDLCRNRRATFEHRLALMDRVIRQLQSQHHIAIQVGTQFLKINFVPAILVMPSFDLRVGYDLDFLDVGGQP